MQELQRKENNINSPNMQLETILRTIRRYFSWWNIQMYPKLLGFIQSPIYVVKILYKKQQLFEPKNNFFCLCCLLFNIKELSNFAFSGSKILNFLSVAKCYLINMDPIGWWEKIPLEPRLVGPDRPIKESFWSG